MAKKRTHPWQKNFLKLPTSIDAKILTIQSKEIIVACIKKLPSEDIEKGVYKHIDISFVSGELKYPEKIVPNRGNGRYSQYNVDGKEIVRKDLPKVTRTYLFESPNWGDWSKGSHEVSWDRQVYQREFIQPEFLSLELELVGVEEDDENNYIFKFRVEKVISVDSEDFHASLLFMLNLLQENTGVSDVFPSDATLADYLKTTYVNWEILPPGEREENIAKILSGTNMTEREQRIFEERYDFLVGLSPETIVQGTSGFQRYFGALFSNNLVAFENIRYGNAIYLMYEDWKTLSKKSRLELLQSTQYNFDRIIHRKGWQKKLERILIEKRS